MNKYEIKYQLEQMTSSVDRLTDVAGKQVNHIEELWKEIELKQDRIKELQETIQDKDFELEDLNQHCAILERDNKKMNEDRLKFKTAEATIEKKINKQFNLESVDN